jgi:hypothetical protein
MNIVKQLNQFNESNIFFCQPIKNNIIENGVFIRILYKINTFVLNGVYLLLPLYDVRIEKYYNKQKYIFDVNKNRHIVDKVKEIEETILKKACITNKTPSFKISENITHGNLKIINYNSHSQNNNVNKYYANIDYVQTNQLQIEQEQSNDASKTNNNILVILKISGIWENDTSYGLTFKCSKTMEEIL